MRLEALLGGGDSLSDVFGLIVSLMETFLPEMERLGIATAADVGLDTLIERMSKEAAATSSVVVGHYQIGCWSRV